jgi:PDDEXK-like uncharacterized protein DUF3799
MLPGVYPYLSIEDYHADKESISRSALMDFDETPYSYWARHLNPDRPIENVTDSMILGSAFHALILEPDKWVNEYAVLPPKVLLKDVGRKIYDEFKDKSEEIESSGKIILPLKDYENLMAMERVFYSNENAVALIKDARIESSFFWIDEKSGLLLKCRPDALQSSIIVDLKTCRDASPKGFQSAMISGGYHIQGAMIRDAVEKLEGNRINHVVNIAIESKYPHNMGIYIIDEAAIDAGEEKFKQLCLDLKDCRESNSFPDYGIATIGLPPWAI